MLRVEATSLTKDHDLNPTNSEIIYTQKLLKLCQIVANKNEMADFIMNYRFKQTKLRNAEIYNDFYSGSERGADFDGIWQAELNLYYKENTSVVGYTNKGSTVINLNLCVIPYSGDNLSIANRVGNLIHEYCHLVGFTHTHALNYFCRKYMKRSVPYKVGRQAKIIALYLLEEGVVKWDML